MAKDNRWTTHEQRILNEYYLAGIQTLLAKLPNRSEGAIRSKLYNMNLILPSTGNYMVERLFRVRLDV